MDEGRKGVKEGEMERRKKYFSYFFLDTILSFVFYSLSSMLSQRAHGVGLRPWIFYAITLCIRAFHMASIVVSLYFKQENSETLISPYNCGRMKRCQSELVSCKVEWFCTLSSFHGGLASLQFSFSFALSPSVSSPSLSVCLFPFSLLALCSHLF